MMNGPERIDGEASLAQVEAIGDPGSRRFRFVAQIGADTVVIWMEKQQLQALGISIEQVLDQVTVEQPSLGGAHAFGTYDLETRNQFRAGKMEIGYDGRRDRLVIIVHDFEEPDAGARVTCRISRDQARELSVDAAMVVAAGRPLCPLCGNAMGPGPHVCPGMNGHLPIHFDEDELFEEA